MGWRYRAGLFLIAAVVIIWVSSAEVTQPLFLYWELCSGEFCAPYMYTPPFTLPCQTTLSTNQPDYTLESTIPVTATTTIVDSPKRMDNPNDASSDKENQWEDKLTQMIAIIEKMQDDFTDKSKLVDKKFQGKSLAVDESTLQRQSEDNSTKLVSPLPQNSSDSSDVVIGDGSKLVEEAVVVQKGVVVDVVNVEPQVFVKNPLRKSDSVVESVSADDLSDALAVSNNASSEAVIGSESSCNILANNFDDSFMMDNLLIHQNSSSVTEYVEDFLHIKSRAEFIFQRSFDDGLLVYCFIDGLKVEIREALELSAPLTLERAFDLAKFQESALEGMFLGFNELELQVHTITGVNELSRGVHRVKDVDAPSSLTVMQLITQPGAATIVIALDKKEEVNASILQGAITRSAGIWEGVLELGERLMVGFSSVGEEKEIVAEKIPSMFSPKFREMVKAFPVNVIVSEKNVLIYDPGGGTSGTYSHNAKEILFDVKVMAGDTHFRGKDIDNRRFFVKEFKRDNKHDNGYRDVILMIILRTTCDKAYKALSLFPETIEIDSVLKGFETIFVFTFDPGGDEQNGQQICIIYLFKEMIKSIVKPDEAVQLRLNSAYLHESLEKKWEGQIKDLKLNSNGGEQKDSPLVIYFGELLIDFVPTVGGISLAEAPAFQKAPGGAPANVAVGISRLGGSSAFLGKVGDDEFGYMLADIFKKNKTNNSGMRVDPTARTSPAFVTLPSHVEREFLFFRHPSADMLFHESELDRDLIKQAKVFHYGSISLNEEPCRSAHLAAMATAKESGSILSYDPNLRLLLWPSADAAREGIMSIWDKADIIKISEDEISFLTGGDDPYDENVVLTKLYHLNLKLLLVSEGAADCRYYTNHLKGRVAGIKVKSVDTTGAGDSRVVDYYTAWLLT